MWVVSHTLHTIYIFITGQRYTSLCVCAIIEFSATTEMDIKDKQVKKAKKKVSAMTRSKG